MNIDRKNHWETVYETKEPDQVSWTQKIPETSLSFINSALLSKDSHIIDIGGGDSRLVDCLIEQGYKNITVLDISAKALDKTKKRLGGKAKNIHWIVSDILDFEPETKYDIWHDRATFHFLTENEQIAKYINIVGKFVSDHLILGTFSDNGPKKCSGLDIRQYNQESLMAILSECFEKVNCTTVDHLTPFDTKQNFLFCHFKKKSS